MNDINPHADNAGIQDAIQPYHVDLQAYYQGRDFKGEVTPYVAPPEEPDTGALKPAQVRGLKMFGWSTFIVSASAGLFQQIAIGAFNAYFGWAVGIGAGVLVLSEVVISVKSNTQERCGGGCKCGGCQQINVTNITNIQR